VTENWRNTSQLCCGDSQFSGISLLFEGLRVRILNLVKRKIYRVLNRNSVREFWYNPQIRYPISLRGGLAFFNALK
jgi:hypothetical protein